MLQLLFAAALPLTGGAAFIPADVTDQTPSAPLQSPNPTNFQPRYMSGIGSNDSFTVFFEDRDGGSVISFVTTTTGATVAFFAV